MKKTAKYFAAAILAISAASLALYIVWRPSGPPEYKPVPPSSIENEVKARGEAFYKQKAYAPVVSLYQKLLEANPKSLELKEKLGLAYYAAGDIEKARPLLEEVVGAGKGSEGAKKILSEMK